LPETSVSTPHPNHLHTPAENMGTEPTPTNVQQT
jgi:hypothetical protein